MKGGGERKKGRVRLLVIDLFCSAGEGMRGNPVQKQNVLKRGRNILVLSLTH